MSEKISIKGLDKAAVLAALYNASKPQGMGFMHYDATPMTIDIAKEILSQGTRFDYLKGRVMKINLSGDEFDPWGYDRDNGHDAAKKAIEAMKETGQTNPGSVKVTHKANTIESANDVRDHLHEKSSMKKEEGGMAVFEMGLSDVADKLGPAVDKAVKKQRRE